MLFGLLGLSAAYFNFFGYQTIAKPLRFNSDVAFISKADRSWLWGWTWGTESTVSVVDRSPVVSFPSRPAAFGKEISDPLLGYVIILSSFTEHCSDGVQNTPHDNSGCPRLCVTEPQQPTEPWIALVQRGGCEFVKKVREAQRLGAKAVVVGGQDPEISGQPDTLVNMYSPEDSSDINIAATYIKFSDYMQLYTLIQTSNTTHSGLQTLSLLITAEYSAWEWYSPIITFIIILLLPSILTFITLLIHRVRAARAAQRDRAPEDVVRNLPWRVWTGNGWEKHEAGEPVPDIVSSEVDLEEGTQAKPLPATPLSEEQTNAENASSSLPTPAPAVDQPWFETIQECAICLSEFETGDRVRVLPCHHIFHLSEVDEWLIQRKKLCPVCKADVTQPAPLSPPSSTATATEAPSSGLRPTPPTAATERSPLLTRNSDDEPVMSS